MVDLEGIVALEHILVTLFERQFKIGKDSANKVIIMVFGIVFGENLGCPKRLWR